MGIPLAILVGLLIAFFSLKLLEVEPPENEIYDEKASTIHPPSVNVMELLQNTSSIHKYIANEKGDVKAGFPFLDSQGYLSILSSYASLTKLNRALVVTGSKGAGKSEGILKMIPAWKELKHIVLDYNFDHIGRVSVPLAKEIKSAFQGMNSTVSECYHTSMTSECGVLTSLSLKAGEYSISIPFKQGDPI